jgi:hypothetical protein
VSNTVKKLVSVVTGKSDVQESAKRAQEQQIAIQQQTIAKQETAVNQQQTDLALRAQAAMRARRGGGLRSLLSGSELGLSGQDTTTTKLGGGM